MNSSDDDDDDEVEEIYTVVHDGFEAANGVIGEEELQLMTEIAFPDIPNVDPERRRKEQTHIMTREAGVSAFCSKPLESDARMLCVTSKYALALEQRSKTVDLYDREERIADADMEQRMYHQRLQRVTKQIQCNMLIQECQTRDRMGAGDSEFLQHIIEKARNLRDTLPKPVSIEEIAETPEAMADADMLIGTPWPHHKESSRPIWHMHTLTTLTGKESVCALQYKPKNASSKHRAYQANANDRVSCTLRVARVTHQDYPKWQAGGIRCQANAVAHVVDDEDKVIVVEQTLADGGAKDCWDTHVSTYNACLLGYKKIQPVSVGTQYCIRDSKHLFGRVLSVSTSVVSTGGNETADYIVVLYARRVLLIHRENPRERSRVFVADSITCSAAVHVQADNLLIVGTTTGSIYYVDVATAVAVAYVDLPLAIPVRGLRMQGPNVLAWTVRSVYRFHQNTGVSPYELHVGQPCGVSGCGSLICTLSHTGTLWAAETMSSGFTRQMTPPVAIATEQEWSKDQTYWQLHVPVTYDYCAVWMGRTALHILYPCGMIRKLLFKVK